MKKRSCHRCGAPLGRAEWCPDCNAFAITRPSSLVDDLLHVLVGLGLIVGVAIVVVLLTGCAGAPFTSSEALFIDSTAGAGGGDEVMNGDAGQAGDEGVSGGAGGAASAGVGGRGMGTGGSGSGAAGNGAAGTVETGCLAGWRGSSCDVCSSSAPSSGRSCADVLDCYPGRSPWYACDYEGATSDLAVELAHQVMACRCGAQ